MTMRWRKLGMIYCPVGHSRWMHSHAALPFPVQLEGNLFRIFFSTRDEKQRSHIAFTDVEIGTSPKLRGISATPVLVPGAPGTFDDSGIGLGSAVSDGTKTRLYYMGWNLGVTVPWRNAIGLAVGDARVPAFERHAVGPIMDRAPEDPLTISYPWVLREPSGLWHMWYGSHLSWNDGHTDMNHAIKHATSQNGVEWWRETGVVIGPDRVGNYAFARPCVIHDRGRWRMWYAFRGASYRIGYAESEDGTNWMRNDHTVGIEPSDSGWDSEMLCYPCVFDHEGARYMLYNGNGYGRTGFGLAVLEAG